MHPESGDQLDLSRELDQKIVGPPGEGLRAQFLVVMLHQQQDRDLRHEPGASKRGEQLETLDRLVSKRKQHDIRPQGPGDVQGDAAVAHLLELDVVVSGKDSLQPNANVPPGLHQKHSYAIGIHRDRRP